MIFLVKRFIEKHFPLGLKTYHTYENIQGAKARHQVYEIHHVIDFFSHRVMGSWFS